MVRKFLSSLLIVSALNFLIKPIWIFGIDLTVQNRLGPAVYGLYFGLLNFSVLFNILLDLGITHFNNRTVAQNPQLMQQRFAALGALKGLLGLVYLLVLMVLGVFFGYDAAALKLLFLLGLNQFGLSLMLFLRSNISGLQLFVTDAILSIADKASMILICGVLLFHPYFSESFNIFHFVMAQGAGYAIAILIALVVIANKGGRLSWRFQFSTIRETLQSSFPFALLVLLMSFHTKMDGVMLERFSGAESAGTYAAAMRLLEALNQIGYLGAALLLPMFSKLLSQRQPVVPLLKVSGSLMGMAGLVVALLGFYYGPGLMELLYHQKTTEIGEVFVVLAAAFVGFAMAYIFGTLLTANGNLKVLNRIAVGGLLVNLVFNLLLIPSYGAYGAAIATLATQSVATGLQFWVVKKQFRFFITTVSWVRFFATLAISGFLVHAIYGFWGFGLKGAAIAILAITGVTVLTKFVDLKELRRLAQPVDEAQG